MTMNRSGESGREVLRRRLRDSGLPPKVIEEFDDKINKAMSRPKLAAVEAEFEDELRKSRFQQITPKVCELLRAFIGQSAETVECLKGASDEQLVPWLNSHGLSSARSPLPEIEASLLEAAPELQKALLKFRNGVKQALDERTAQIGTPGSDESIWAVENAAAYEDMRRAAWSALGFRLYGEIERIAKQAQEAVAGNPDQSLVAFVDASYRIIGRSLSHWPEDAATAARAARELVRRLKHLQAGPTRLSFD